MAFATYRDIVSGSSGSSKSSKISTYQDIKKSITPTQFEENRKKLQETNDRNLQIERQKKQEEVLKKSQAETEKYLQDFNDASTGFGGSILKRFGLLPGAPVVMPSPVTQSPAYLKSQEIGAENTANLSKTVGKNIRELARNIFTENTTNTIYDTLFQSGVDKNNLDIIENNTKKIVELHNKRKLSTDQIASKKLDNAISFLLEQNRQVAETVGGEIKDKTNLQIAGQSVGTAMELLPLGVGSGMTQAGKLILEAGTKQALKALGKEAALYGATVASSGKAQEKGATAGDVATSGVIGGLTGLATIAIPGLAKWATKDGGKYIQNLFKKISTDGTQSLSKEEAAALKEIVTSKEEVPNNTSVTEQTKTEVKPTQEDPLLQEARKYKSAEEFVNSFNLMKSGEVTSIGQLPIEKVNKTQIKAITERGLPHTDTGLKAKDFAPGRKVTQPLEVYSKGGSYVVENGNHRLAQAIANGDTHIPVVFKRGEGKSYTTYTKSQLTDIWKKAQEKPIDTSLPEQLKPDVTPKKESVTAKKMNERFGKDEQLSTEYDVISINRQSDEAAHLISTDKEKAVRTAFNDSGSNTEKIAILNELFEKSVIDKDHKMSSILFNRIKQLSTQTAQSLNMFKALTEVNPHYAYMSEVVSSRLNGVKIGARNISEVLKKESKQDRIRSRVSKQSKELKESLSNSVKFENAQKVFNDLICK